jgi:hypothetical protein
MSNVPMSPSPRLSQLAAVAACALLLAGCGGGGGDAQASQPSVQVAGSGAITPGSSSPPTGFKFCAAEGQRCEFGGTAKIAYGAGSTWTTPISFTNGVNCGNASFTDLLPGIRKQCYIESAATILATAPSVPPPPPPTSTPPVIDMPSAGPVVPLTSGFSAGSSEYRVRATTEMPAEGGGDFRTVCEPTHMSNDDPIVFPGQPGRAHLHTFFGNTGTNAFSTTNSLTTTGNSSCRGGRANRTAYWVPSMVDTRTNVALMPTQSHFYYKAALVGGILHADIKPFPVGLRMIAGDPSNTVGSYQGIGFAWRFICHNNPNSRGPAIQNCPMGDDLVQEVFFPSCWDGVNLDSPDHKSHMAYAPSGGSGCPATHPVPLVGISVNIHYRITEANQATHWRLSSDNYSGPAGYSSHADWWNGWVQSDMEAFVSNCVNKSKNCHSHLLGDGREIY